MQFIFEVQFFTYLIRKKENVVREQTQNFIEIRSGNKIVIFLNYKKIIGRLNQIN